MTAVTCVALAAYLLVPVAASGRLGALDANPPPVVIDLNGPPRDQVVDLVWSFTIEGRRLPLEVRASYSEWDIPQMRRLIMFSLETRHRFVTKPVGRDRLEVVGWHDPAGRVVPVRRVRVTSPTLTPAQLPKQVGPPPQPLAG